MLLDVKIDSLTITRQGRVESMLNNITFCIGRGSVFAILGRNGSGKSTLAKALGGLLDERFYNISGEILFEGKDIMKMTGDELAAFRKKHIRYVLQDSINTFDPLRKLGYYFAMTGADAAEISDLLEYFKLPAELPELYPFQASAGMLQRTAVVLALLSKPSLIILDEPTSSLDAPAISLFMIKLKEYIQQSGAGVLLITQDVLLAEKLSDKIMNLDTGTLM